MAGFRYRLIDTAGSKLAAIPYAAPRVQEGELVHLPRCSRSTDDEEQGQEGGVQATLVVDA
jgi:hypothetical protein